MSLDKNLPHPESGLTYHQWYRAVDREVQDIAGVRLDDLGDFDSYNMWADNVAPTLAAEEVLEENGFPFEG